MAQKGPARASINVQNVAVEPANTSRFRVMNQETTQNRIAAMNVVLRRAAAGPTRSSTRMASTPMTLARSPAMIRRIGSEIAWSRWVSRMSGLVAPITIVATTEPTYDSKISAPIPATSPTLSPTLSAIVAGLRGSSSGIPASTLPTRSAPTSAAFV
ncbi:MAG: hypothetical protein P8Y07_04335 [Gemmatimonadales bacterium]